ncbi:MAG TPA: hypothetical protein ENN85_01830 [Methanoculleus sp.]|nr:hypothetical protein [Methanoculleus sp.]
MKPGAIQPGDFSDGSGVEGRRPTKRDPPVSQGADPEAGAEGSAAPPRKKKDFRGSGRLHFREGGDADIFDSTKP